MRLLLLLISLFTLPVFGQRLPQVQFNHFYLVMDSSTISAIQNSDFMKNEFAATITRTTRADSAEVYTGTYLEGVDNYFEILDSSGAGEPSGNAGVGFSVDGIGEIGALDSALAKQYKTEIYLRKKQYDDKNIPWYIGLGIKNSGFDSLSHISFWVMEYKKEYFDYNSWKHDDKKLTRIDYLHQYERERKNKILKRFTGITIKATEGEQNFFSRFLLNCGYEKINNNSFASPENFLIHFVPKKPEDRYAVAFVEFESNLSRTDTVTITNNIQVQFQNYSGKIIFK
jgi:hypothetical protein